MTKQFKVGDEVNFTDETDVGIVIDVDYNKIYSPFLVQWEGGYQAWLSEYAISLAKEPEVTIKSAKELKAELESEILRLIGDFNKKTNLQIKDIDLDRERMLGVDCFYRVNVRVEI